MRADRLLSLLLLLQAKGKMTAQALADELEVSRRTILRDVDALSIAGVPIYTDGGHGGGIALDENYRVALTGLDETEVRSLFITRSPALLGDLGMGQHAEDALDKLMAALPNLHQRAAQDMRQRLLLDPTWWWHNSLDSQPMLPEVQRAVYDDRRLRMVYEHGRGDIVERVVDAYSLVAKAGVWYLIGCHKGEFHMYRVSRLHEAAALGEHFQRDPAFDLETYWQERVREMLKTFPTYRAVLQIRVDQSAALKWDAPGTVQILDEADSWLTVALESWSMDSAKAFILGLGGAARVVEPDELREVVLQAAREVVQTYSGDE